MLGKKQVSQDPWFSAVLDIVLYVQDFESDTVLRAAVTDLLEEMVCNSSLLPAEHKAAASILRTISRDTTPEKPVDLEKLLVPIQVCLFKIWIVCLKQNT